MLAAGGAVGIGRAAALAFALSRQHGVVTNVLEAEGMAWCLRWVDGGSAAFAALAVRLTKRIDEVNTAVHAEHGAIDTLGLNTGIAHKVLLEALDGVR